MSSILLDPSKRPITYLSRTEQFSACHRLHSKSLSDEENVKVFGKCNRAHGHGHNYKVEVTLRGQVDAATGMVINLVDLKQHMKTAIMDTMDHRNLDAEVVPFKDGVVSTVENISIFIWEELSKLLDVGLLWEVRVNETEKNVAIYRGEHHPSE
eukprot:gene470-34330_t